MDRDSSSIFDHIQVGASSVSFPGSERSGARGVTGGSTGLVAAVAKEEFERIVRNTAGAVVLRMPVRLASSNERQRLTGLRYIACVDGIIFVTTVGAVLDLGSGVREVACLGVSHEGRPLGRDETAV